MYRIVKKSLYPLFTRISALVELAKALPDATLVYQMGKVGSTTVCEALSEAGISSVHVHYINHSQWKERAKLRVDNGSPLPPHFHKGRLLRHWIGWTDRQVQVVSLVRDPIARYISEVFQTAHFRGFPANNFEGACDELRRSFTSNSPLRYSYEWFDREIGSVFDIDVFDYQFNKEKGFVQINNSNADILILTLEKLDTLIPSVLSEFVGKNLKVKRSRKRVSEVYDQVKSKFKLPKPIVRRLYDSTWTKHFYTDKDIEKFVERWSDNARSTKRKH